VSSRCRKVASWIREGEPVSSGRGCVDNAGSGDRGARSAELGPGRIVIFHPSKSWTIASAAPHTDPHVNTSPVSHPATRRCHIPVSFCQHPARSPGLHAKTAVRGLSNRETGMRGKFGRIVTILRRGECSYRAFVLPVSWIAPRSNARHVEVGSSKERRRKTGKPLDRGAIHDTGPS